MPDQWMTYLELGERLGCTANAARVYAQRHRFQRRAANKVGGLSRVLVPEDLDVRERAPHIAEECHGTTNGLDPQHDPPHVAALAAALAVAHEQLHIANKRAWRAEQLFEDERRHRIEHQQLVDQLWTALADAQGAERIANTEAAGLREAADRRREWRLLRRLAWAWLRR